MAAVAVDAPRDAAPPGASPDLTFNDYDLDEELARSIEPTNPTTANRPAPSRPNASGNNANDLGIDEEITVKKARRQIPKLDEERLLSANGIPKLRRITKTRLKFKGKGHEFADVGRLLNLYQLWLDDLYPKAKFADGVAIIEKVGHSRRMQMMRRAWIDEGKPRDPYEVSEEVTVSREEVERRERERGGGNNDAPMETAGGLMDGEDFGDGLFVKDTNGGGDVPDEDDDLDMLLAETAGPVAAGTNVKPADTDAVDNEPDDLDALLAGEAGQTASFPKPAQQTAPGPPEEDYDDDMDAMDAMYGM